MRPEYCAACGHSNEIHWPACETHAFCAARVYRCDCKRFVREADVGASFVKVAP